MNILLGGGLIGYVKSKPLGNGQIISIDVLVVVMIIAVFHEKLIWPPYGPFQNWSAICWISLSELQFWGRQQRLIDGATSVFTSVFFLLRAASTLQLKSAARKRDFVVGKSQARSKKTKTKRAFPILDSCLQVQFPRIKDVYSRTKTTYKVVLAAVFYLTATNLPLASFDIST